jgi:predicted methyltransferase
VARLVTPLLTHERLAALRVAHASGDLNWRGSLDLGRGIDTVALDDTGFAWQTVRYPWPGPDNPLKERTIYHFDGARWSPVQRFGTALIKLVPTAWGPPTFEIDGVKMLPTAQVSPWDDAAAKVALVQPRGRHILDACGGLGYFAAQALTSGASQVTSFEKNPEVHWLRGLNPWSPDADDPALHGRLTLHEADVSKAITSLPSAHFDAALHDPPRFGIAGELYALAFYEQLARVLKPGAPLFHYTGTPNAKTSGRDVPGEVIRRLGKAGFRAERRLDGVFAVRHTASRR